MFADGALHKLNTATPDTYPNISFEMSREFDGPELPEVAFYDDVRTLTPWYTALVACWRTDCFRPCRGICSIYFRDGVYRSGRHSLFREVLSAGLRRLQMSLLSELYVARVSHVRELHDCGTLWIVM